jgi:hypothetical protein
LQLFFGPLKDPVKDIWVLHWDDRLPDGFRACIYRRHYTRHSLLLEADRLLVWRFWDNTAIYLLSVCKEAGADAGRGRPVEVRLNY